MIFFFLGYDKIDIKQNFSALGIIEPQSKEVWSLSYVTSMIDISIFRNIKIIPWNLGLLLLFPEIILPTTRRTKK